MCKTLPPNVQRCLHDRYREEHAQDCDAVMTRLDATDLKRIDGLFFAATPGGK